MREMGQKSKDASFKMARATTEQKNRALEALIAQLVANETRVLGANLEDLAEGREKGLGEALLDRLSLQNRIPALIGDIRQVISLGDPVGETFDEEVLPNKLVRLKQRVPIGVLGVIYESRPNVTLDISALAIKSGNAAVLKGGSESHRTNEVLACLVQNALEEVGLPRAAVQLIPGKGRALVQELLKMNEFIDLIIPRGSAELQEFCRLNSSIPVITGGVGICHLFVDVSANVEKSLQVIFNAKTQRPTVCNALDTILVHQEIAESFLPKVAETLRGVELRLDAKAHAILGEGHLHAGTDDWDTEWMSLVLGVKVVANLEEAVDHIQRHSRGHSDGILTEDKMSAEQFVREVDSAAVYVNASTRFTDGGQFGLGAEVAVSTQRLHARGPMGLRELTVYKWVVRGDYQIR